MRRLPILLTLSLLAACSSQDATSDDSAQSDTVETDTDDCPGACLDNGEDCTSGGDASCASGICDTTEAIPTCEPADTCGNSVLEAGEACDDGNTAGSDGCNDVCLIEDGGDCSTGGSESCASGICDATEAIPTCEPADTCGNSVLEAGEGCDDGNIAASDGCNDACLLEDGGDCSAGGSAACASGVCDPNEVTPTCEPADTCGNGLIEGNEGCDDGNLLDGDGCSPVCTTPDLEPNESIPTALPTDLTSLPFISTGNPYNVINPANDEDWYAFEITSTMIYIEYDIWVVSPIDLIDTRITLCTVTNINSPGGCGFFANQYAVSDSGLPGAPDTISATFLQVGTYYMIIDSPSGETGAYEIHVVDP